MLNFVQRVLVGKASGAVSTAQTAGSVLNLAAVAFGDLYLVDDNGLVLDAPAAAVALKARVVRGTGNNKVTTSSVMFKGLTTTKYTFQAYSAPVAQVSTFTNLLGALLPNTQYQIQVVIPQDLPLIANRQDRVVVSLITGATVSVNDLNRLVANFNRQRDTISIIVASTNGTDLILTGKTIPTVGIGDYEFVRFDANFVTYTILNTVTGRVDNLLTPTAIQSVVTAPAVGGKGVATQVRQLERISLGNSGFTDPRNQWYRGAFPYGAADGVGYDLYNVQQNVIGEGMLQNLKAYPVSTLVALATGSAQQLAFGPILDSFVQGISPATQTGE